MKITPESLTAASVSIGELGDTVRDTAVFPHLDADRGVAALQGSPIATALAGADPASVQAKNVLASRYAAISALLSSTAASYTGRDDELADALAELGDLNSNGH